MNKVQQQTIEKIRDLTYFLKTHNKSYTKKHYQAVLDIEDLLDNLEENLPLDYTKVFAEALDYMELDLVKVSDNKWLIADRQLCNIRFKNEEKKQCFKNSKQIIDDINFLIDDYFIRDIEEELPQEYYEKIEFTIDLYNLKDNEEFNKDCPDFVERHRIDFEVLDLMLNHKKEVDLEKVCHEDISYYKSWLQNN